ncbi:MAG: hypothetical protein ACLGIV_10855 [Actinomycetes bacterium]
MRRSTSATLSALTAALILAGPLALAGPAVAASDRAAVGFGSLYYDGAIVRTVATPTSMPGHGVDAIYAFPGGAADGQLAVTSTAPGDRDYHGGRWAVYLVTWHVTPYLLTDDAAVRAAATAGDVTVARAPAADFVCPVQPVPGP